MSVRINGLTGIELPDNAHIGSTSDTDSIKFPANGSVEFTQTAKFKDSLFVGTGDIATGNKLDDYETGSFTPVIAGNNGVSGQTYSIQEGSYVKVGDLVYVEGRMVLTNKGTLSGTNAMITDMPFAAASTAGRGGNWNMNSWSNITGSTYSMKSYSINSSVSVQLTEGTTGGVVSTGDITNTTQIDFQGVYKAA